MSFGFLGGVGFGSGNGGVIISKSGVAVPLTGTTSETALVTIPIPANTVGANGNISVTTFWEMPSSSNQKSMRVRLGAAALAGSIVHSSSGTTIASARIETMVMALNATNSQKSISINPRGTDYLTTQAAALATSIDMTASQNIVITGQLASGSETLTLIGYMVQASL